MPIVESIERDFTEFNEAIRKNPHDANAYHGRGKGYFDLRLYNVAISDFDRAINLTTLRPAG
jgi:tetratricopeptide (TPR) repeat protein